MSIIVGKVPLNSGLTASLNKKTDPATNKYNRVGFSSLLNERGQG